MAFFTVQVERREDLQGVVSVVSILTENGVDVTKKFEEFAEAQGIDLQGAHLYGETEQDFENEIKRYISRLSGIPVDDVEVIIDG